MSKTEPIQLTVELPSAEAWAFAEFLKRAGHSDYLSFTIDDDQEEAYRMQEAASRIREALASAGVVVR